MLCVFREVLIASALQAPDIQVLFYNVWLYNIRVLQVWVRLRRPNSPPLEGVAPSLGLPTLGVQRR